MYLTRLTTQNKIKPIPARAKVFEYLKIRNIKSINKFKVTILDFIRSKGNSVFDIAGTNGIKLLTRLSLNFSQLNEHKFRHNVNNMADPMCTSAR